MFARTVNQAMPPHQARTDAIVTAARAKGTAPAARLANAADSAPRRARAADALAGRLAEELATIGRTIDAAGESLADDPMLLVRHAVLLQSLDNAAQTLSQLAAIMGAADPLSAAHRVPVGELRARLLRGDTRAALPRLERKAVNPLAR